MPATRWNLPLRPLVLLSVALSLALAEKSPAEDWPRFLGNRYDGVAADPGIRWDVAPSLNWSLEVGDGYGIGSVSAGKFFQMDAGPSPQGQSTERLRCVDLESGALVWAQSQTFLYRDLLGYEDGPRSSPTVVDELVYTMGVTGILTCRKVADGAVVWSVDTNTEYGVVQNFFGVGCSPLVLDKKLFVMVGGSPPEDQQVSPMRLDQVSPNGSALVAFDRHSGKELWRCGEDLASYSSPRPIKLDGETLILLFARGGLLAIDPEAGKVRWRFDHRASILESVNAMVPVVVDDQVLISECYEVGSALLKAAPQSVELLRRDVPGRRRDQWAAQSFRSHWATPIVIDGFLYGGSGRNPPDSDFRCVNFVTGEVMWRDERRIRSTATRVGDHLLVLEERGLMQVVRPSPERLDVIATWQLDRAEGSRPALKYPCWAAPIVVGDKLLVRGTDHVVCLQFTTD